MQFTHASGQYLEIDGAKIYYEVTGDENKPALLTLHGGFGNMEDFNAILPEISNEFKVIGIDTRGHGKSTLGPNALTYEQLQKDVEGVLERLNINTLSIMGFSDGGVTAYRLAALTTLNIENLVTIAADWHVKYIEPMREIFLKITGESWRKRFPDTFDAYQKLNPEPDFDLLAQSVVNMWLDSSSSGFPNEAVTSISCPLLIVRGDDDHLVSRDTVFALANLVQTSQLLNIPFAGHVAFEQQQEVFMIILKQFLRRS